MSFSENGCKCQGARVTNSRSRSSDAEADRSELDGLPDAWERFAPVVKWPPRLRRSIPGKEKQGDRAGQVNALGTMTLLIAPTPSAVVHPARRHPIRAIGSGVATRHPRCPTWWRAGTGHAKGCDACRINWQSPRHRRCRCCRRRPLSAPTIRTRRRVGIIIGLPPAPNLCSCGRR